VHAPTHGNLTLKALQRGKRGEVLAPSDARFMTAPVLTATLTPGDVLYIPRGFYHHTDTMPRGGGAAEPQELPPDPAPSLALTVAIVTEDVFSTWLHLLGEAVQAMGQRTDGPVEMRAAGGAEGADRLVRALRRLAAEEPGGELGARLREALPRALMVPASLLHAQSGTGGAAMAEGMPAEGAPGDGAARAMRPTFAKGGTIDAQPWRLHAQSLLSAAMAADGMRVPGWLTQTSDAGSPGATQREALFLELDVVLHRKRVPCELKLEQIDRFLREVGEARLRAEAGGGSLDDELRRIDLDSVFEVEKRSKDYVPADRSWHRGTEWGAAGGADVRGES
jgi:hypothetical protein